MCHIQAFSKIKTTYLTRDLTRRREAELAQHRACWGARNEKWGSQLWESTGPQGSVWPSTFKKGWTHVPLCILPGLWNKAPSSALSYASLWV